MNAPQRPAPSPADLDAVVADALRAHAGRPGALLPLLHDVQDRLGYLPPACVPPIARALNLSRAEVIGVISFYHHFRRQAPAGQVLQLCQAEACQSMGALALMDHARKALDGAESGFSVEPVYCLGQCANAPAAMIGARVFARLTPARLDEFAAPLRTADPR
jgi:formate dehydrogenase subunit gamma